MFDTVSAVPLDAAVVVAMKPVPFSVSVNAPGFTRAGVIPVITGMGLVGVIFTVRVMLFLLVGSGDTSRITFTVTGLIAGANAGAVNQPVLPVVPVVALPPLTSLTYQTIAGLVMFSVVTVN